MWATGDGDKDEEMMAGREEGQAEDGDGDEDEGWEIKREKMHGRRRV